MKIIWFSLKLCKGKMEIGFEIINYKIIEL